MPEEGAFYGRDGKTATRGPGTTTEVLDLFYGRARPAQIHAYRKAEFNHIDGSSVVLHWPVLTSRLTQYRTTAGGTAVSRCRKGRARAPVRRHLRHAVSRVHARWRSGGNVAI